MDSRRTILLVTALASAAWMLAGAGCGTTEPALGGAEVVLDEARSRDEQAPAPEATPAGEESAAEREPLVALASGAPDEGGTAPVSAPTVSAADFLREASRSAEAEKNARRERRDRLFAQLREVDQGTVSAGAGSEVRASGAEGAADGAELEAARRRLARAVERIEGGSGEAGASEPTTALRSGATPGTPESDEPPPAAKPAPQEEPATPLETQELAKTEPPPAAGDVAKAPVETAPPPVQRPQGHEQIVELHQKTGDEVVRFFEESFPDWLSKGYVMKVPGKGRSLLVFGESAEDPITKKVLTMIEQFDFLEVEPTEKVVKPRYITAEKAMDMLVMRGLAEIWKISTETKTASWKVDNKTISASHTHEVYSQTGVAAGQVAPLTPKPKIPYVYEMPRRESFDYPTPQHYADIEKADKLTVTFDKTASTEDRGGFLAVGTEEDIARIEKFVEEIDKPARLIMIEVQVIELDASKFLDLGIDSVQFGERHTLGGIALPLPGESISQPGFGDAVRRNPDMFVPDINQEGLGLIFDDTSIDLSGRFMGNVHALVREGDAEIRARPKILTIDDRVSVLHIGQDVPTFKSTGVTRDSTEGNLVSEINNVETQYVGITLNIRPRVTGGAEDEVSLLVEVMVNALGDRERVFEEDLLGIPVVIKRHYIGESRVKNHRPIVLGGLIQEQEVESVNKIPLLGDLPLLGYLFRRTQKTQSREEVIFVITPHILSQRGVDRIATPKESPIFDTFDSALFNDNHVIKGRDVIGINPLTGNPADNDDGKPFTEEDVFDLTLLNIIKQRELVSKLGILEDYLSDVSHDLNFVQKKWPERTLSWWSDKDQEVYFRAAAIVIENIKELNPDLNYEEIVLPRREIILPTTPYRISLTYDRVKALQSLGQPLLRGQRVELSEGTIGLLRDASGKSFRDFADYLQNRGRKAEDHGELIAELKRFYRSLYPDGSSLEGISYPELYRRMAEVNMDFTSLATYLQENLTSRYEVLGPPDIGVFDEDLKLFVESSLTLFERAKRLRELNEKWSRLGSSGEEANREKYRAD